MIQQLPECTSRASDDDHGASREQRTRRGFLAAVGAAAAVGLAGCQDVTQQSFEASTVALTESSREELWLSETARDSETITREGPGGSEVDITNKATVYSRAAWMEGE